MKKTILDRLWKASGQTDDAGYLRMNYAVAGPNNLLRHEIGRFCIGHGDGTYDLITGEFS